VGTFDKKRGGKSHATVYFGQHSVCYRLSNVELLAQLDDNSPNFKKSNVHSSAG
jgi:hypothetical protein